MVVDPVSSISFRGVPMIEHESVDQFPVDDMQDCFQFGPENHLVPTLIDQVINPSVVNYSIGPTVFWGGRGSGKTMLVKELERRCRALGQSVLLIDGKKNNYQFSEQTYPESDPQKLWIIDNVDQFTPTNSMIHCLCGFLDHCTVRNNRVVMTMGVPPSALLNFPARLRSRFHAGVVLKLQIQSHNRAKSNSNESSVGTEFPLNDVGRVVSKYFGISMLDLKGRSRQRGIVLPRQLLMYLAHKSYDHSIQKISKYLGRDHSTVSHGCQVIEKKLAADLEIKKHILLLKAAIEKSRNE